MDRKIISLIIIALIIIPLFSGCLEEKKEKNHPPEIEITFPLNGAIVSSLVMISGVASDPDEEDTIKRIEIKIDGNEWSPIIGSNKWSYDLDTNEMADGYYTVKVKAWDGNKYSETDEIRIRVENPEIVKTGSHKWALFVAAANFPSENESKLGNGGLRLAEEISAYLIEECDYSTSHIRILFDDGWIRENNGFGDKVKTLQERKHEYDITYGGATKKNVISSIEYIKEQANNFDDSEVFIWFFGHGLGNEEKNLTGGKILETSKLFLWDSTLTDTELGDYLSNLESEETCVIVDACFSGGFADKTIFNLPEFFLFNSNIPKEGRVVISGASKFRVGYASLKNGPLFSNLWLEGMLTEQADGFKSGLLNSGRPTTLDLYKDGEVSVEEAFYYAKYVINTNKDLDKYSHMKPQMNDRYPKILRNNDGLILG
ncbi:MAG: Ig-like domain-containing protein [Candidatus Thermoplasmatota archaeon]